MSGNVWEICIDLEMEKSSKERKVTVAGGSFKHNKSKVKTFTSNVIGSYDWFDNVGFRCAVSVIDAKNFKGLKKYLSHPFFGLRVEALKEFTAKRFEGYLDYLIKGFQDKHFFVRLVAAKLILEQKDEQVVKKLTEYVKGIEGEKLWKILLLFEKATKIVKNKFFTPFFGSILINSKSINIKQTAALCLAYSYDIRAYDYLRSALKNAGILMKRIIAYCFGILKDKRAVGDLKRLLFVKDDRVLHNSACSLREIKETSIIEKMIKSENKKTRIFGLYLAYCSRDKRLVKLILPFLEDKDRDIRKYSVLALGAMRVRSTKNDILKFIQVESDINVKIYAIYALSIFSNHLDKDILPLLLDKCVDMFTGNLRKQIKEKVKEIREGGRFKY